jgi:hypothetical protein
MRHHPRIHFHDSPTCNKHGTALTNIHTFPPCPLYLFNHTAPFPQLYSSSTWTTTSDSSTASRRDREPQDSQDLPPVLLSRLLRDPLNSLTHPMTTMMTVRLSWIASKHRMYTIAFKVHCSHLCSANYIHPYQAYPESSHPQIRRYVPPPSSFNSINNNNQPSTTPGSDPLRDRPYAPRLTPHPSPNIRSGPDNPFYAPSIIVPPSSTPRFGDTYHTPPVSNNAFPAQSRWAGFTSRTRNTYATSRYSFDHLQATGRISDTYPPLVNTPTPRPPTPPAGSLFAADPFQPRLPSVRTISEANPPPPYTPTPHQPASQGSIGPPPPYSSTGPQPSAPGSVGDAYPPPPYASTPTPPPLSLPPIHTNAPQFQPRPPRPRTDYPFLSLDPRATTRYSITPAPAPSPPEPVRELDRRREEEVLTYRPRPDREEVTPGASTPVPDPSHREQVKERLREMARQQRAERGGNEDRMRFFNGYETIRHGAFDPTRRSARQASTEDRLGEAARGRAERSSTAQSPPGGPANARPHRGTAADSSRRPIPTPEAVSGRADQTERVSIEERLRELALRRAERTDSSPRPFYGNETIRPGAHDPTHGSARQETPEERSARKKEEFVANFYNRLRRDEAAAGRAEAEQADLRQARTERESTASEQGQVSSTDNDRRARAREEFFATLDANLLRRGIVRTRRAGAGRAGRPSSEEEAGEQDEEEDREKSD